MRPVLKIFLAFLLLNIGFVFDSTGEYHSVSSQENPYAKELNKWLGEQRTSPLTNLFPQNEFCRTIASNVVRRAWGMTHPLSGMTTQVHTFHENQIELEIEYLLTVSENFNGRYTGDPGSGNIDRFVLRQFLDALLRLKNAGLFEDKMEEWLTRVKLSVDWQYDFYWHGPGQENLPAGNNKHAGYYPNSDGLYVLLMGIAGVLYDEPKYTDRAQEFVGHLENHLLPDGGFNYLYGTNEIPTYHSIVITSLARYYEITGDTVAGNLIRNTVNYYPNTYGPHAAAEQTSYPWWKRQMGQDNTPSTMDIVASITGNGQNKFVAERFRHNSEASIYAVDYWNDDIPAITPEDNIIYYDGNLDGARGRFGYFSWNTVRRGEAVDGFAGALITNPTQSGFSLNASMEMISPEVGISPGTGPLHQRAAYSSGHPFPNRLIMAEDFAAQALTHTLYRPWIQNPADSVPWSTTQIWFMLPENIFANISLRSNAGQDVPYIRKRMRFSPLNAVNELQKNDFAANQLRVKVYQNDYIQVEIQDAVQSGTGSFEQSRLGTEILFIEDGRTFHEGEVFNLDFQVHPHWATPNILYQPYHEDGFAGFSVLYNETQYLIVYNPTGEPKEFIVENGVNIKVFTDYSTLPLETGLGSYNTNIGPFGLLVITSENLVHGKTKFDLNLRLQELLTGSPLANAVIRFNQVNYTSDENGLFSLPDVDYGFYDLIIENSGYLTYKASLAVFSDSITEIRIKKDPNPPLDISIRVIDKATRSPIYRALVRYGASSQNTNHSGLASIQDITEYYFIFTAEHNDYFIQADTVVVYPDSTYTLELTRKRANVTFKLDDWIALPPHSIQFTGYHQNFVNGQALFFGIDARKDYSYSILQGGNVAFGGDFFLETDTIIHINLTGTEIIYPPDSRGFRLYPNPAKDHVNLVMKDPSLLYNVDVYDITGNLVLSNQNLQGSVSINIRSLPKSVYLVQITGDTFSYTERLVLSE